MIMPQNIWAKLKTLQDQDILDRLNDANSFSLRTRVLTATLNAGGAILVPAPVAYPGFTHPPNRKALRLINAMIIAIGGAATTSTSVNVTGTRAAAPVQLIIAPIASLGQSVPFQPTAAAHVAADGAAFTVLDPYTPLFATIVGGALTVATAVDFILDFAVDLVP